MPKKWIMDKNYEWIEIEVFPKPIVESIKRPKKKPDPQGKVDWCPCGRVPGARDRVKWGQYCSRYCLVFHTQPAPGYKRKTHYDCWKGSGLWAYSPVHPPIVVECEWCCEEMALGYGIGGGYKGARGCCSRFCGDTCRLEATQCARKTKIVGTTRYNKIFEIIAYLRNNGPATAQQIASVVSLVQQYTFNIRTVSSLVRPLVSQGHLIAENHSDPCTLNVYSLPDPTKSPKEILLALGANLK